MKKGFFSVEPRGHFTHTPRYPSQRTDRKNHTQKVAPQPHGYFLE